MRHVGLGLTALMHLAALPLAAADSPFDIEIYSDLRLSHASGEVTWLDGKLGKTRYGGAADGSGLTRLRLAEVSLIAKAAISWDLQAFAHAKFDPEQDKPVDVVEAYLRYAPAPKSAFSYAIKAGLFFPHISRENTSIAWTSPYTITPSAINSWVGEEVRALGLEAKGTYKSGAHAVDITAGAFGFNDTTGALLAFRGWALGDAKVGAFSRLPLAATPGIGPESGFLENQAFFTVPVKEVDNRVGYYGALDYRYNDNLSVGAFYYDSSGDPEVTKDQQYSWDTRFWNFYAEGDVGSNLKLIAQYMTGTTLMGFRYGNQQVRQVDVDFYAAYALATKKFGRYRLTLRYDWYGVDDNSFIMVDNNYEDGNGFTVAFFAKLGKKSSVIAEYLRVDSVRPARLSLGNAADQHNNVFQLSFRQRF